MQILGIDTVLHMVTDLDRSTEWYRDMLGIAPGPRYGGWQTMTMNGDVVFALHASIDPISSNGVMVSFRVHELDAATAELEAKGVVPSDEAVTDTGFKRFRSFHDPDGNMFQLIEVKS